MLTMLRRINQFLKAMTAAIRAPDEQFLAGYLTSAEQELFWQMTLPDQRHCLNVAYTAQELAKRWPGIRLRLLTRAALLHDIGRTKNDLSTADKVLAVLFSAAFPCFARDWADSAELRRNDYVWSKFHHVMFVYYHHGEIGARRLQQLGSESELTELVASHHRSADDDDVLELTLLRQADQLN